MVVNASGIWLEAAAARRSDRASGERERRARTGGNEIEKKKEKEKKPTDKIRKYRVNGCHRITRLLALFDGHAPASAAL